MKKHVRLLVAAILLLGLLQVELAPAAPLASEPTTGRSESRAAKRGGITTQESSNVDALLGSIAHNSWMQSPEINALGTTTTISFQTMWEIESVDSNAFDVMSVQVSPDGTGWTTIGVLNPPEPAIQHHDIGMSTAGVGKPPVWVHSSFDVPEYLLGSGTFRIRFNFDTGDSLYNDFEGWYVDDVTVRSGGQLVYLDTFSSGSTDGWSFGGTGRMWHPSTRRWRITPTGMSFYSMWCGVEAQGNFFKSNRNVVPVVLVNGLNSQNDAVSSLNDQSGVGGLGPMYDYLCDQGFEVHTPAAEPEPWDSSTIDGNGDLDDNGDRFASYLQSEFGWRGIKEVDVVGHSMGGLIARSYAGQYKNYSDYIRVRNVIELGTPNNGYKFQFAPDWFLNTFVGDPAASQMRKKHMKDWNPDRQFPSSADVHLFAGTVWNGLWERQDDGVVQVSSVFDLSAGHKNKISYHSHGDGPDYIVPEPYIYDPDEYIAWRVVAALKNQSYTTAAARGSAQYAPLVAEEELPYQTVVKELFTATAGTSEFAVELPTSPEVIISADTLDPSLVIDLKRPDGSIVGTKVVDPATNVVGWSLLNVDGEGSYTLSVSNETGYDAEVALEAVAASALGFELPIDGTTVALGSSAPITVTPPQGVTAASVDAVVMAPGAAPEMLSLYDDGQHGDAAAGDGTFGAEYLFAQAGTHAIQAAVRGDYGDGSTARFAVGSVVVTDDTSSISDVPTSTILYAGDRVSGLQVDVPLEIQDSTAEYSVAVKISHGASTLYGTAKVPAGSAGTTVVPVEFSLESIKTAAGDGDLTLDEVVLSRKADGSSIELSSVVPGTHMGSIAASSLLSEGVVMDDGPSYLYNGTNGTLFGTAQSNASPIQDVQVNLDGAFLEVTPVDGAFGGASERFSFTIPQWAGEGIHALYVSAITEDGRTLEEERGFLPVHGMAPDVSLNDGQEGERGEIVPLTISAVGFESMYVSSNNGTDAVLPPDAVWQPVAEAVEFPLPDSGNYIQAEVWFKTAEGMIAGPYVDGISLYSALRVPEEFSTIQSAVDSATAGDDIVVSPGTYAESVVVNKAVTIRSSTGSTSDVVINPSVGGAALRVVASGVVLEDLTVEGSDFAGVYAEGAQGLTARRVAANSSPYGFYLTGSPDAVIESSVASGNAATGIALYWGSNHAQISNTDITGSDYGIYSLYTDAADVNGGTIDCDYYGVFLDQSDNSSFSGTTIANNQYAGAALYFGSEGNGFQSVTFQGNGFGAYLYDSDYNWFYSSSFQSTYYGVYLDSSSNNAVSFSSIDGNPYAGIALYFGSSNNYFDSDSLTSNGFGVYSYASDNNTFQYGLYSNTFYGLYFDGSSNNTIDGATITNNPYAGVVTNFASNGNIVRGSLLDSNGFGTYSTSSALNNYVNNTYSNNLSPAYDDGVNTYDDGMGWGNIWQGWTGPDADLNGIVDSPFQIPGGTCQDNFPIVH